MKKSTFKKAGVAVLSMAMLLSMGAVSMPTFAAGSATNTTVNPNGKNLPGSVHISMPGLFRQGEGDDAGVDDTSTDKYDYLSLNPITSADVTVYRVATLTGSDGWKWESLFSNIESDLRTSDRDATNPNIGDDVTDFAQLLKRVDPDDDNSAFSTKSEDLKKLASYLERTINTAIANGTSVSGITVASKTLDYTNAANGFELPIIDDSLADFNENDIATKNVIGYYIIVTETDQAGVLVQPVLISLKNGAENPKNISLKGTTISIDKKITSVGDDDDKDNHDDKRIGEKSSVVSKKDTVHYEISAQLPKYDPNLPSDDITKYVIHDIASNGITIDSNSIKVIISEEDISALDATGRAEKAQWTLTGGATENFADYQLTATAHGFDVSITGLQMRGENSGSSIENTGANPDEIATMENMHILVSFDATVNDTTNFYRTYVEAIDYSDGSIVIPAGSSTVNLADVLTAYQTYANKNTTGTKGYDEAVRYALATGKYADALANIDWNATDLTAYDTDAEKVGLLLAIDHYNSTRNGETNYAEMTYGNNYSTGKGEAKMTTEDTKLYSVDISLNKYVEKLMLEYKETYPDAPTYGTSSMTKEQINALVADHASITNWEAITGTSDNGEINAIKTTLGLGSSESPTADQLKAAKYLLDQETAAYNTAKADWEAALHYDSKYENEVVEGAIFKLVRGDGTVIGAAISTGESDNGVLKQLVEVFVPTDTTLALVDAKNNVAGVSSVATSAPAAATVQLTFTGTKVITVTEDGKSVDKEVAGTYYYTTATDINAWQMLTTGEYTLTEESVPTGFKKWKKPVTITIDALDEDGAVAKDTGKAYDGAYQATAKSDTITEVKGGAESLNADGEVTFKYFGTDGTSEGVLTHNIYNEYADTLPATGGMGTVLFTAGGIAVVLMAGAMFVVYMKKRKAEEE